MTKEAVIEILKSSKPFMQKKYWLTELALFGSFSRNEQTAISDIDLLVDFNKTPGLNFFDMLYDLISCLKEKLK